MYDQYRTSLQKIAKSCDFASITPDKILRGHLIFRIRDPKMTECLLQESDLTLKKTDEICHAAESMAALLKVVKMDIQEVQA